MQTLFNEIQLFDPGTRKLIHYDLPDAVLVLREQFFEKAVADHYYSILLHNTPWTQHKREMYDKLVSDPRLTCWYGAKDAKGWTPELLQIKKAVEDACGIQFDSVLLNYYRNGKDSVSWHSDHKPAGKNPPIASISFGATRSFRLRHKTDKSISPFGIPLTHGSFLLMAGTMQDHWEHHIPKTSKAIAPRINLTFRITQ